MELALPLSDKNINMKNLLIDSINKNPKDKIAYFKLSDIYADEKKYDKAIKVLDSALLIFKDDNNILENKLSVLLDSGEHDKARLIINKLLEFKTVSAYTYNNNGFLLSIEGKHKEAIESYKKALAIDNTDSSSMINMAISYKAIYEYDKAIDMLENAYKKDSNQSVKYLLESTIKNREDSLFSYDAMVSLLAKPDRFNLLIPKSFNAQIINNILNIHSEDNKISIMISYNKNKYDYKKMEDEYNMYMKECGNLFSVVKPFSIEYRDKYKDELGSGIFTSKIKDSSIFNAFALVNKNGEVLIMTISSNIFISNKLIELTNTIINSLYFREH